ncbi:hypothetical protein RHSIM_Rhsim01G0029300 [Rhododendron simsii]|uniref:Uncharacterized protein n=1 Tax=Rhododendron simsii TaxID=118357 RepID=A0A834HHZ8_RHOSS|nr:hypothetical protein RHSIM_Rhsim01G0029300 [Rhododendron simsii]
MKKQRSGPSGYFPDDCWELVFQKLREDDERDLDSISLVSKQFLSLSNRVKHRLNVYDETIPLLPNLLQRFRHIETIVFDTFVPKNIDGLVDQVSRSGVLNLQAITFLGFTQPPRDGFKALASNIQNDLKVLDCSGLRSIQDNDLVLIADLFPRLEELRITGMLNFYDSNDKVAAQYITDDGVDALASKLKELKKVVIKGTACFITDKSLISLSTNCVKLRGISLSLYNRSQHYVTEDGIDFVVRHSPNLTSLSLKSQPLQPSAFSFAIGNPFTHAKNLHSLTMFQELVTVTEKRICSVAKARPPLKKLKLVGFMGEYHEIHGALKLLLQACQLTLEELTLRSFCRGDTTITELAQYLSNLTSIELDEHFELTSVTFYTLTKYCPLLEKLVMARPKQQVMDTSSPEYFHRNYRMRHLDICNNMWLNNTILENFGHICPNLQFLCVRNCLHLTNVGIGEVLRRCPAITKLNISDLKVSGLFGRYSDHSVLNLKTLKACGIEIDDKGMAMIGNRCRNLQYLDIECCNEVTDRGVMEVVRNCERLRYINLHLCEKVSTNILPQMVLSRPSLRNINLPRCDDLSEQMINLVLLSFGCRVDHFSSITSELSCL